jgi:hypothetical protein
MTSVTSPGTTGVLGSESAAGRETVTLKLWPEGPPSAMVPKSEATVQLIESYGGLTETRISDITDPTLTLYRPE